MVIYFKKSVRQRLGDTINRLTPAQRSNIDHIELTHQQFRELFGLDGYLADNELYSTPYDPLNQDDIKLTGEDRLQRGDSGQFTGTFRGYLVRSRQAPRLAPDYCILRNHWPYE